MDTLSVPEPSQVIVADNHSSLDNTIPGPIAKHKSHHKLLSVEEIKRLVEEEEQGKAGVNLVIIGLSVFY